MDGPVLRAVGTVISVGNTSLAIETQEHGRPVSFLVTTTTVMPASVPVGSRVEVAYHAVGVSTQVADRVVLLDAPSPSPDGAFEYRVEWLKVVEPGRVDVVASSGESLLTLVTCYPFGYVGTAPLRYVVRARPR